MAYAVELAPAGMSGSAIATQFLVNSLMGSAAPLAAGALTDWVKLGSDVQTGLLSTFYFSAAIVLLGDGLAFFATRERPAAVLSVE